MIRTSDQFTNNRWKELCDTDNEMPEGFCPQTWHDRFDKICTLHWGRRHNTTVDPDCMITCCTDGTRPVSFKLER